MLRASFFVQMSETVHGVSVTCHQPLVHRAQEKKIQHSWVFRIHSEVGSIQSRGLRHRGQPQPSGAPIGVEHS